MMRQICCLEWQGKVKRKKQNTTQATSVYDIVHLFFLSGIVVTSGSVSTESLNLVGCNNDTLSRSSLKLSTTFSPVFADVSSSGQSHDSQNSNTSSRFTFLDSSVIRSCNREKHYCHCSLINHYCFHMHMYSCTGVHGLCGMYYM